MEELMRAFPELSQEEAKDGTPTFWVGADRIHDVLRFAKDHVPRIFLYDLTAIDGRRLRGRHDFIVVYHLFSLDRAKDLRLKVPLTGEHPAIPSAVDVFTNADWYEREVFDMFGVSFEAHPNLRRILMPPTWIGHPLRKDHPARATEMGRYQLPPERALEEDEAMRFRPEDGSELMFLNIGPQHPGTHGVFRIVLALDGERIVDAVPDIGFHHRGAEKMGERQTWHTFIPYTDRIDYLAGVQNNLAYLIAVEKLAGIEVPERAKIIRIMMAELFRISSHLVWYGTFAQDLGALSPVFYMFTDRERIFDIVQAVCGSRMHPSWFRIGGVAQDLPRGWDRSVSDFLEYMPRRLREYDVMVLGNSIFKARTKGVGEYTAEQALEWGVTGPGLRACGVPLDLRRVRPYGGYDQLEFDVPTRDRGDAYARAEVRVEEIRQSLRIVKQCLDGMPSGPVNAEHPLATPPPKPKTLHDIETLIAHFLNVSWGPVMPKGEALSNIEAPKGINGYYVVSDGGTQPYRVRIRTPSFPHLQMLPTIARGGTIPDLMAILGSVDFVMGEVDR